MKRKVSLRLGGVLYVLALGAGLSAAQAESLSFDQPDLGLGGQGLLHFVSEHALGPQQPAVAAAREFSQSELQGLMAETARQAALTQEAFIAARDKACAQEGTECLSALEALADPFFRLTKILARFDAFTALLDSPEAVSRLSAEEKRSIRHSYAWALKASVVTVPGLDDLLNKSWGDARTRLRLDRAQLRLQRAVEGYAEQSMAWGRHVIRVITPFPAPGGGAIKADSERRRRH